MAAILARQPALPRPVVVVLGVAAGFVALQGMREYSGVIGPLFLAVVLVIAAHPLESALRRRGTPIWLTLLAMLAVIYGSLIAFLSLLIVSIARLTALLPQYGDQFDELQAQLATLLANAGVSDEQISGLLAGFDYGRLVGILSSFLSSMVSVATSSVLILCLLFFAILDATNFGAKTAAIAAVRPDIARTLSAFARGTRRYLVVSTVFGLIVAVLDIVALTWIGVSLPVLWGLLGFVTNYIPNIGFFIGVAPPAFLALLESGWQTSLLVILVYAVINFVIQSLVQPKFVGDSVGLSTTVTFISLILWAGVLGPLGALLAVPLTLLLKCVLLDPDPSTRWASILVGSAGAAAITAPGAPGLVDTNEAPRPEAAPAG